MNTSKLSFRLILACAALFALSGCVSNIRSAGSVLTTRQSLEMGQLVPQSTFTLQDVIAFHVDITWDPVTLDAGSEDIQWNWYKDGKLVAHYENYRAYLKGAPNGRTKLQSASSLGVGHFKVECLISSNSLTSGRPIASAEFDIK
jgi:hypothetical protein